MRGIWLLAASAGVRGCNAWAAAPIRRCLLPIRDVRGSLSPASSNRCGPPCLRESASAISSSAATESPPSDAIPYDWRDQWYAVTFANHVPNPSESAEVTPVST